MYGRKEITEKSKIDDNTFADNHRIQVSFIWEYDWKSLN